MKHLVAIAVVGVVAVSTAAALAADRSYTDDTGDAGTAPDLTNVTVTDSNGFLAFKIAGTLVPSSSLVIYVDTDRKQSTGADGDELMLGVDQESDGKTFWFASRWIGSKWERAGIDVTSQSFPESPVRSTSSSSRTRWSRTRSRAVTVLRTASSRGRTS